METEYDNTPTKIVSFKTGGDTNIYTLQWVADFLKGRMKWTECKATKDDSGESCISFRTAKEENDETPWLDPESLYVLYVNGFIYENTGSFDVPVAKGGESASSLMFDEELGFHDFVWITGEDGELYLAAD